MQDHENSLMTAINLTGKTVGRLSASAFPHFPPNTEFRADI